VHPTTVATGMILNEATFRQFRPDLDNPTRADFEEAAMTLNRLPVAALEPGDVTNAVMYLVSDEGRYVTGTTHLIDAGGAPEAAYSATMLGALLCRLRLHDWTEEVSDSGVHYRLCRRCGRREERLGPGGDDAAGMH
jgi:hypothetical protein